MTNASHAMTVQGRRRRFIVLPVLLALASVGCRGDHPADGDHDEIHIGHVIPAHKPKDFPAAVRKLGELNRAIDAGISRGQTKALVDDRTLPIALDIATWLPEIAADSDMPEASWNAVNTQSATLVAVYKGLMGEDAGRAAQEADRSVSALEGILAAADPRWFEDGGWREPPSQ
jgi:hypothetical protein